MKSDEEIYRESCSAKICMITSESTKTSPFNLKTFEKPLNQSFNFPATYIRYVLQAMSPNLYEKLTKTCKYFYSKEKISLIENANLTDDGTVPYLLSTPPHTYIPFCNLFKIWTTKALWISSLNPDRLSNFCKKLYKSTVCRLHLFDLKLTEKEFDLLFTPQFLLAITVCRSPIIKTNGNLLTCEEVIEKIPKAFQISLDNAPITPFTFIKITEMPRKNKIKRFSLNVSNIPDSYSLFNVEHMKIFVKKCVAPSSEIQIYLTCLSPENKFRLKSDHDQLRKLKESWMPSNESPIFLSIYEGYWKSDQI